MKITYLYHSGFLLEWERCYWLFDYYRGAVPPLDGEKSLFVFSSHSHADHFNPAVFALAQRYPHVTYVFSNQIRQACRRLGRDPRGISLSAQQIEQVCGSPQTGGAARVPVPEIQFLTVRTDAELPDGSGGQILVHTLQSTDCGCAFVLTYEGRTVYHAGDLHWWTWPGESEAENRKMAADYKKEMEYLAGRTLDLAFTPLDPRQEQDYALGMRYLLGQSRVRHVFPMHFLDNFSICDQYLSEYGAPEQTEFHRISRCGQSWELEEDKENI